MKNRFEKCLADGKPVLLAFIHSGQPNAEEVKNVIDHLRAKYGNKAEFLMMDRSTDERYARKYQIDTYPGWVLFMDGREVWRDGGSKKFETIDESVSGFINAE